MDENMVTPYLVEFYDESMNLIHHDQVEYEEFTNKFDYLSLVENDISVSYSEQVQKRCFVRVKNNLYDDLFIVTSVDSAEDGMMTVYFKSLIALLDISINFDTKTQGNASLEGEIAKVIRARYINNSDSYNNIPCLNAPTTISSTTTWGFNLKADVEGGRYIALNSYYETIVVKALSKYRIVVNFIPNYATRKIDIVVGTVSSIPKIIESELSNILAKNIIIRESSSDVNKLIVYDGASSAISPSKITYYLHPDGTFDTRNTNRLSPVIEIVKNVDTSNATLAEEAAAQALDIFGGIQYNNLIELTVLNDDEMINPSDLAIGQLVAVKYQGVNYDSILTGYERSSTTKLIFGTIRIELSKIIKGGN